MAVFRVEKKKNYTTMSNYHFRDKNLSWKAKGILSCMLSLPEDWDYSMAGLATLTTDGLSATRSALKELEEHGYLIRRPVREKGKIIDWEYIIYEFPQQRDENPVEVIPVEEIPGEENTAEEKPLVENPQVENHTQLNTKQSNTKKSNTKEKKERKTGSFDAIIQGYTTDEKTVELLQEWLKVRKAKRAAMTDRAIQLNINKLDDLARQSGMTVQRYLEEVICRGWAAFYHINNYGKSDNRTFGMNGIAINQNASDDLDGIL